MDKLKKVMIADDSQLNKELLTEILGDKYEYVYADNGGQVIEYLNTGTEVDIILLDINMPIMDGFGVLEVMKRRHWIEETPVVVISAETETAFLRKAYDLGAVDYIPRPFSDITVQFRVENTLMIYTKQRQLVKMVEEQVYKREEINNAMINIFSRTIELRNFESGKHSLRIRQISDLLLHRLMEISDKYPLSEQRISAITALSSLHDIGKITVPADILNKPGKLSPEEWEKMKSHSAAGDEIIASCDVPQDGYIVKTARAICRWHHERWDGGGYPDGLKGDDIPIEAQVVSLADVYDALTSSRCYKDAYTHEKAIEMICGGECGSFNPLLMDCMRDTADELAATLRGNYAGESRQSKVRIIADEVLSSQSLPAEVRTGRLLEYERKKSKFFKDQLQGIQIEYEVATTKITYTNWYNSNKQCSEYFSYDKSRAVISEAEWKEFKRRLAETSPQNPDFSMNMLIPINGIHRWHRFNVKTIWSEEGTYTALLGQLTDIHDSISCQGLDMLLTNANIGTLYEYLKRIFSVVRMIDPTNCKVLTVSEDGKIIETASKCYDYWDKDEQCTDCYYLRKGNSGELNTRLETRGGKLYSVISKPGEYRGRTYILQMAFPIEHSTGNETLSHLPERGRCLLLNFYKDTVTDTYSRNYLEDFRTGLEKVKAVAMCDVDGFKRINDTYGHVVGDYALKFVAQIIKDVVGRHGVVIRYGGDEFLIAFSDMDSQPLSELLRQIRDRVEAERMPEHPEIPLTVTVGGVYKKGTLDETIAEADGEMYRLKYYKL